MSSQNSNGAQRVDLEIVLPERSGLHKVADDISSTVVIAVSVGIAAYYGVQAWNAAGSWLNRRIKSALDRGDGEIGRAMRDVDGRVTILELAREGEHAAYVARQAMSAPPEGVTRIGPDGKFVEKPMGAPALVRYTDKDGKPLAGMMVSRGGTVMRTDERGELRFESGESRFPLPRPVGADEVESVSDQGGDGAATSS